MDIVLLILSILCALLGIAGCILPALPGPPLTYLGMLLLHWSGYVHFSTTTLIVWAVVTVVVGLIDFFLTPWMTRRFGGSKAAEWGSLLGLVAGFFIPLPFPVGPLFGPFLGALIAEKIVRNQSFEHSARAAFGSFLSFFVGTGIKLIICISMIAVAVTSSFL